MERTVVAAGLLLIGFAFVVLVLQAALSHVHLEAVVVVSGLLLWQLNAFVMLRNGAGVKFFAWADPVVESLFPTCLLIVEAHTVGPRQAAFFSAGPIVYLFSILLSVVRLRTMTPVLSGVLGSAGYLLVINLVALPLMGPENPISRDEWVMLQLRAAFIFFGGLVGSFVVLTLRRASGQAHRELRSKELFGKYRLGEEIASGGMGVVLRATYCPEGGFARDVAMKRIHPHLINQAHLVAAFRSEAELSARMLHPNIVQVLDFGRVDDTWFYAMEYVEGLTLSGLLRACRKTGVGFPPPLLAYIGREVCAGLDYAHRGAVGVDGKPLHVIHRDLTGSNVMLANTGQVKIVDFGVAKALKGALFAQTQTVAGKLPYMSPEQINAAHIDGRSDLFTFGVVLWECLCRTPLFHRESEGAILSAVLHAPIPAPSEANPSLPAQWDGLVLKALARDPAHRFANALELGAALAALTTSGPAELAAFIASLRKAAPDAENIPTALEKATPAPAQPIEPATVDLKRPPVRR